MAGKDSNSIGIPLGTRLLRVVRTATGWTLWTGTRDYRAGSTIQLSNDGSAHSVVSRADEGDDVFQIRPSDKEVNDAG